MRSVADVSPGQFALFRILFGLYLCWHFAVLIPDAAELFSDQGLLPDPQLNPTHGLFPNPLVWWGTPAFATGFVLLLVALSLLLLIGWRRRCVAFLLWFGWAALFNRNNLISNPGLPYVGLLLLVLVIIPDGEPFRWRGRPDDTRHWFMPGWAVAGAWFLMATGYTFSGLVKLGSPSWVDGTAFYHLISNPLARPGLVRDLFLTFPSWVHTLLTWGALSAEIAFLPLSLWRSGRAIAWLMMVGMHLSILSMVAFADLTLGMLMVHVFTFDRRWVRPRMGEPRRTPLLLYDEQCGLCRDVVHFLVREDRDGVLRFAPLQGPTGQAVLRRVGLPTDSFNSLVYLPDATSQRFALRTDGILEVFHHLGGVWRVLAFGACWIPTALRNGAYDRIARMRYRWTGGKNREAALELPSDDRVLN